MNRLVAVVGRPNVGKSTLVNRCLGERVSIVDDQPGVTRDRLYLECEWTGHSFVMIDTGGLIFGEETELLQNVQQQAWLAVDEAAVIMFMVDGRQGMHPVDQAIADELRQKRKKVIVVVNKIDDYGQTENSTSEFYEFGLGEPQPISAHHGLGVGDLLDLVIEKLNFPAEITPPEQLQLAIVGRPNVGKSSIVNALLNQERVTVSNIPGTTRDAIDSVCKVDGERYLLIDTAGIRKKSKVRYGVERFSVVRAIKAINRCDIVILVLDATAEIAEQDQRIAGLADDMGKAVVIVVNKWDLIPDKTSRTMKEHADEVRRKLFFLNYASILYTSALTKKRLRNIFEVAKGASDENQRRITTGLFNEVLNEIVAFNPPPGKKNKRPRITYGTQVAVGPPTFALFSNYPHLIDRTYLRYVEKKIRENFGFDGTPIRLVTRSSRNQK